MTYKRGLLVLALIAMFTVAKASPVWALDLGQLMGHGDNDPTLETFKIIHVSDLKGLMRDGKGAVYVYDANNASTRAQFGEIPGAVLLVSYDKYDLSVLPPNKRSRLVFYCANWL